MNTPKKFTLMKFTTKFYWNIKLQCGIVSKNPPLRKIIEIVEAHKSLSLKGTIWTNKILWKSFMHLFWALLYICTWDIHWKDDWMLHYQMCIFKIRQKSVLINEQLNKQTHHSLFAANDWKHFAEICYFVAFFCAGAAHRIFIKEKK